MKQRKWRSWPPAERAEEKSGLTELDALACEASGRINEAAALAFFSTVQILAGLLARILGEGKPLPA